MSLFENLEPLVENSAEVLAGIRSEIESIPDANIVGKSAGQGVAVKDRDGKMHYLRLEGSQAVVFGSEDVPQQYLDVAGAVEALKNRIS